MSFSLTKGDWFFRLQIEVPPDGDLTKLIIQICHKIGLYEVKSDGTPNYGKLEGEVPGMSILTLPNPDVLESKYPGITDAMKLLQYVAIKEGLEQLYPPPIPENSPELIPDSP